MKKKRIVVGLFLLLFISTAIGGIFFLKNHFFKKDLLDELINISELDDEFMDHYYEEMNQLLVSENRKNILIVVSKKKPKEVYGAKKVVEAPNSIYYLEYEDEESQFKAKEKLEKDESLISVVENREYTFTDDSIDTNLSSRIRTWSTKNENVVSEHEDNKKDVFEDESNDAEISNPSSFNSWGIEKAGLDHAISYINQKGGEDVVAAIIDTGCDMDLFNASFDGKIEEVYNLHEVDTYGNDVMFDHFGHGTHIAGTIAEGTPDNVKILPVKVSDSPSLDTVAILDAVTWITDNHKADVINMSYGGPTMEVEIDPEYVVIEAARRENIISVAAAGNSYTDMPVDVPGAYDNTISVSAVDSDLNKADFSNYNDAVTFAAPGVDILSINGMMSGTSMATPHVVSSVAIVKSLQKDLSLESVIDSLSQNVIDLGVKGKDPFFGYGFIDLSNFVLCEDDNNATCTNLSGSSNFIPTNIEIEEVITTPYNYGSLTNILPTKIKLLGEDDQYKIVSLDKLDDVIVSGYDPYVTTAQTVNVSYLDFEVSFVVQNPEQYEMGWKYDFARDDYDSNIVTDDYVIVGYYDHNMELEKLYFPGVIDGHNVVSVMPNDMSMSYVFGNSSDAEYYREVYLPSQITKLGTRVFTCLKNLNIVKSFADELSVSYGTFQDLKYLTVVDANILFEQYAGYTFDGDFFLQEVRLSSNNTTIPFSTFFDCRFLKNIEIPEGVLVIDDHAFGNTGIEEIILPNNLQRIGNYAFVDSRIKNVELPDSLQTIGNGAFSYTAIREVNIPAFVTSIGFNAFSGQYFNKVTVSEGNTIYDSREDCNAVIESATNTLVVGSNKTIVPSDVKIIGNGAFKGSYLLEIELPEGLEKIEDFAFSECYVLTKIVLPRSLNSISPTSFLYYGYYEPFGTKFYVHNSSYAYDYVTEQRRVYVLMDETPNPPAIRTAWFSGKLEYLPFETLDLNAYTAKVFFEGMEDPEIITDFRDPVYENGRDSFRYGDWNASLLFDSSYGYYNLEMGIPVEIGKLTPDYDIPDVYANVGFTLADVELPYGFEWEDESIELTEIDDVVYDARYTPLDTNNYKVVEDIAIPIHVVDKTIISPSITVENKIYDGTLDLSFDHITVSGIEEDEYSFVSATLNDSNVGPRLVSVTLQLTDEKYETCMFSNGEKETTYVLDITVLPERLKLPTLADQRYVYNGTYQSVVINGYNNKKMNITGNIQKDAGHYYAIISLKNDNYQWEHGYSYDYYLSYDIEQATIQYYARDLEIIYDGNEHGTTLAVYDENTKVRFMDDHGNYSLLKMPVYVESGIYTIKYMLSIDDNYITVYGENTLTIKPNGIVNNTQDVEVVYDGENHTIQLDLNVDDYVVHYSINNTNYDLDTLPVFKDVGEHIINYKIDSEGYDSITGSNKVKIYGVQGFDSTITLKNNVLVVDDFSFTSVKNKITTYSTSTSFYHLDSSDHSVVDDGLKTGDKINIVVNGTSFTYQLAIRGDVNGNGDIDIIDYIRIMKDIMGDSKLTGLSLEAADMNKNNEIDIVDYIRIMKMIMEESE